MFVLIVCVRYFIYFDERSEVINRLYVCCDIEIRRLVFCVEFESVSYYRNRWLNSTDPLDV